MDIKEDIPRSILVAVPEEYIDMNIRIAALYSKVVVDNWYSSIEMTALSWWACELLACCGHLSLLGADQLAHRIEEGVASELRIPVSELRHVATIGYRWMDWRGPLTFEEGGEWEWEGSMIGFYAWTGLPPESRKTLKAFSGYLPLRPRPVV